MKISQDLLESHGLSRSEFERIEAILGREPTLTELGIFSVMWSEHCSYKSSRLHLEKLPTQGPNVVQGPGENAGVVDIGEGQAAVFKIESHNHPSFIEPYQGSATGVGGIIRDIFTMGARPIALMDSLHFGPLNRPSSQWIMEGVVSGIAAYGNCMGIPTVGGEVCFQQSYANNPVVNIFCLGVAPINKIFYAKASGNGNPIIYVGAKTGRDGIHGATMASQEFTGQSTSKRPTVQIGDPFLEKLLLEACLEVMKSGAVVGIQDMGAAGLTCSTCEMGSRAGMGIEIDLARVPQREPRMTPYEIMLSESQERMLLVAERGREDEVLSIFGKWDLDAVVIGEVKDHHNLVVSNADQELAVIPNTAWTDEAPLYNRPAQKPTYLSTLPRWEDLDFSEPSDYSSLLLELAASFHLCSRGWIYEQYDHLVRTNTVVPPGSDAAVLRLKDTPGGLAMSLDGNSRHSYLDPRRGAMLAVAESCRNLVCTGARPLAATNCLNFASPENPEVMWQFIETIAGIRIACQAFNTPITGGNVSFYNETDGVGIFPTPVLGMIGKIDNLELTCGSHFKNIGDRVYLLGDTRPELAGSIYSEILDLPLCGPCPKINLDEEKALQNILLKVIGQGWVESAHDLSEGGLAFALVECSLGKGLGLKIETETPWRPDHFFFSEAPSRVVVSIKKEKENAFLAAVSPLAVTCLGEVTEKNLWVRVNGKVVISLSVNDLEQAWKGALGGFFKR